MTPRVTRSSSRQPERSSSLLNAATTSTPSGSRKKSASIKKSNSDSTPKKVPGTPSSSKKKKYVSPSRSRTPSPSRSPVRAPKPASKVASPATTPYGYTYGDNGAAVADELINKRSNGSRTSKRFSLNSASAAASDESDEDVEDAIVVGSTRPPLVALLPHVLTNIALVAAVHFLVIYEFGLPSFQSALLKAINSCECLSLPSLPVWLNQADQLDLALWSVVPLYIVAGFLLRWGVALVVGPTPRGANFAASLTRVISGGIFIGSLFVQSRFGVFGTYESINAIFVLQFAFLLQEFLINLRQFTSVRRVYTFLSILVTGYFAFQAIAYEKLILSAASTTPSSIPATTQAVPSLLIALNLALLVSFGSSTLASLSNLFQLVGSNFLATVVQAFQAVVNFGIVPILSIALYSKNDAIFGTATATSAAGTTFLESSGASFLLVASIFLLILDGYTNKAIDVEEDVKIKATKRA